MVEKPVKTPNREYLTARAKSIKASDPKIILGHTRKCHELNIAENCKNAVEKPLTSEQSAMYNRILQDQREKEERHVRRRKPKKYGSAAPKEEFRNF